MGKLSVRLKISIEITELSKNGSSIILFMPVSSCLTLDWENSDVLKRKNENKKK